MKYLQKYETLETLPHYQISAPNLLAEGVTIQVENKIDSKSSKIQNHMEIWIKPLWLMQVLN